jgi:ankyrin repeat protein
MGWMIYLTALVPYFAAWLQVHNIDERWSTFSPGSRDGIGSPLYYAALCGFYDLAERLIMKHPDQVNARGGRILFPLPAALYKRHFRVATLLYRHGAVVDVQGYDNSTPLHAAPRGHGQVDIMRWLLDHGADTNSRDKYCMTPLIQAAVNGMNLEAVQVLLEHNADTNSRQITGNTSLSLILEYRVWKGQVVDIVHRLLEHGADPNIPDNDHRTALHEASSRGLLDATRLLLSYRAKIDEKDRSGRTPFQLAASKGHHEVTKLLLEHGAVP